MGSATSQKTFIRGVALVIGQNPESYNNGQMSSPGIAISNTTGNCILDFHSNNDIGVNYDSRIISTGGTANTNGGALTLSANTITLTGKTTLGSSTAYVRSAYDALATVDLVNYRTMALKCPFLASNNIYTGNNGFLGTTTFNILTCNNYQPDVYADDVFLATLSTATIYMGSDLTTTKIRGSTIDMTSTGNLKMGSATSTNAFIQNSDGLIIGQNPESYNPVSGFMSAPGMRFTNKAGVSVLDFHSNTVGGTKPDSRILAEGGTTAENKGTLTISAGSIVMKSPTTFQSGMAFGKGNYTSAMFFQSATSLINYNLAPLQSNSGSPKITFQSAFSSIPIVMVTRYDVNMGVTGVSVIMGTYNISTTGFYLELYNTATVNTALANTYGYSYIAFGAY